MATEAERRKQIDDLFRAPQALPDEWDGSKDLDFCVYHTDASSKASIPELDKIGGRGVPIVRLYGVTERGVAVNCLVRGFMPYFYIKPPQSFLGRVRMPHGFPAGTPMATDAQLDKLPDMVEKICQRGVNKDLCSVFRSTFIDAIRHQYQYEGKKQYQVPDHEIVHAVELVRRETVMGYRPNLTWMLKITFGNPSFITRARDLLTKDPYSWLPPGSTQTGQHVAAEIYKVFEANIPYPLRCMIDTKMIGCPWVTLKAGTYVRWAAEDEQRARDSVCAIEVMAKPEHIIAHAPDDPDPRWQRAPPMIRFTFDIECLGRLGRFPDATQDAVCSISMRTSYEPAPPPGKDRIIGNASFNWGRVPPIEGASVLCYYQTRDSDQPLTTEEEEFPFLHDAADPDTGLYDVATVDDERRMLRAFRDFLVNVISPTVLCGHNIVNFDIPYLLERAETLGMGEEFAILGVTFRDKTRIKPRIFSSKAYGSRMVNEFEIPGRIVLDTFAVTLRDQKLRSYSLNSLAMEFLGETKADVPHQMITPLWHSGPLGRQRVAEYCLRDTDLTDRICQNKLMFIDKVEMARACGVPVSYILMRGQQVRVVTMLMRYALPHNRVVPFTQQEDKVVVCSEKYKGATVLQPKSGFYEDPIIVCARISCVLDLMKHFLDARFRGVVSFHNDGSWIVRNDAPHRGPSTQHGPTRRLRMQDRCRHGVLYPFDRLYGLFAGHSLFAQAKASRCKGTTGTGQEVWQQALCRDARQAPKQPQARWKFLLWNRGVAYELHLGPCHCTHGDSRRTRWNRHYLRHDYESVPGQSSYARRGHPSRCQARGDCAA